MSSEEAKNRNRFAVLVCEDAEKWGGLQIMGKRHIDLYQKEEDTEWRIFNACEGDIPSVEDIDKYQGFVIGGSHHSVNDDKEWVKRMEQLIVSLARKSPSPRVVGLCFGHQLLAKALGGIVSRNPSGKFILQTVKVKPIKNGAVRNSIVSKLFESGPLDLLESHSECVTELPRDAVTIASSTSCDHEMVLFTDNILGLQSHPECTAEEFEEKILPTLMSSNLFTEEDKVKTLESFKVPLHSSKVNNILTDFLHE